MNGIYDLILSLTDTLLPFSWAKPLFMKHALIAVLLITPMCSAMGVLVVSFKMAFFSDTISHSAFTGIALGIMFSINPYAAMILFGLAIAVGIVYTRRETNLSIDTIIGVFFCATVSFGIAIISYFKGLTRNLPSFLYGEILTVGKTELYWFFILFVTVFLFLYLYYNRLLYIGLNDKIAYTKGINVKRCDYMYSLVLALVITVSIKIIGILLVTGMIIVPAAAARNVSRNASTMFWSSILFGLVAGVSGLISSFYLDTSTGATIVLWASVIFFVTLVIKKYINAF